MNKTRYLITALTCMLPFMGGLAHGAAAEKVATPHPEGEALTTIRNHGASASDAPNLTRFDLEFPGGKPRQLVEAIQKATGRPLNAIVPEEFANIALPRLVMKQVNVPQLFEALQSASQKRVTYPTSSYYGGGAYGGYTSYQTAITSYGFRTQGKPSDDSIWYFYVEKPDVPGTRDERVCRFYSLAPYLEQGMTVDDITTAIATGARMLGEEAGPEFSFHKDTKLLIAVGEPTKLEIIDAVLKALGPPKSVTPAPPATVGAPTAPPAIAPPPGVPGEARVIQPPSGAPAPRPAIAPPTLKLPGKPAGKD